MNPTHLSVAVTLLVLLAGVLHAVWNAIAKTITDSYVSAGLIGLGCTAVAAVCLPFTGLPDGAAMRYVVISTVLHIVYTLSLIHI